MKVVYWFTYAKSINIFVLITSKQYYFLSEYYVSLKSEFILIAVVKRQFCLAVRIDE